VKTIAKLFCENMLMRRERLGLTQAQVAERMDISTVGYHQMETGKIWIAKDTPAKVAKALECTEIDLFQAPPEAQNPLHARVLTKLRTLPDSSWPHVEALIDGLTAQNQAHLAAAKKPKADQSR
jgi:transcriptional regulator with XRE-family HTH domain